MVYMTRDLEIVTRRQAANVASIDAQSLSSDTKAFVKLNTMGYYIVLNTWFHQCDELSHEGTYELSLAVQRLGLTQVIAELGEASDRLVHGNPVQAPRWFERILSSVPETADSMRIANQVMRFPKRFTPLSADLLQRKSLDAFYALNTKLKVSQHIEPSRFVVDEVKYWVRRILRKWVYPQYEEDGRFSSGSTAEHCRALGEKLLCWTAPSYWAGWDCTVKSQAGRALYAIAPYPGDHQHMTADDYVVEPIAVPKSNKTHRIIVPQQAYRGFYLQAIAESLNRAIERGGYGDCYRSETQEPNRHYAFLGSIDGSYSTIDMSSASDSISCSVMRAVMPQPILAEMDHWREKYFRRAGKLLPIQMWATSGSPICFPCETILFLAVSLAGTAWCERFSHAKAGSFLRPAVYGDDMVVDSRAFATVCEFLECLGMTVNAEKSFSTGHDYRESCGVEFYSGLDSTTRYYPRHVFSFERADLAETIASLCALQHKLWGCWGAQAFISEVVREFYPDMTSSEPFTECDDLWENVPRTKPGPDGSELHMELVTAYRQHKLDSLYDVARERTVLWLYREFLLKGPRYDTPLDRLLGVSTPRVAGGGLRSSLFRPTLSWALKPRY